MVRSILLAMATVMAAGTCAQAQDWSRAGGPLLAAPAASLLSAAQDERMPAPDQPYDEAVRAAADRYGLAPKLLHAVILVESGYHPEAVSPAGAEGLTQLMPDTARALGVRDRADPGQNLAGGAAYLARQVERFQDLRLALAAFNAGPERVARLGQIPPYRETRDYVTSVLECYLALAAGRSVRSAGQCRSRTVAP